jgi:hypothetical protein
MTIDVMTATKLAGIIGRSVGMLEYKNEQRIAEQLAALNDLFKEIGAVDKKGAALDPMPKDTATLIAAIGASFKTAYAKAYGCIAEYQAYMTGKGDARTDAGKRAYDRVRKQWDNYSKAALAGRLALVSNLERSKTAKAKGTARGPVKGAGGALPPAIAAANSAGPLTTMQEAMATSDDLGRKIQRVTREALGRVQALGKSAGFAAFGKHDREVFASLLNDIGTLNELVNGKGGK